MKQKARIFRSSKRQFDCRISETKQTVAAAALATLLKDDHLVVGDWVELSEPSKKDDLWVIDSVEKRKNEIFRNLPREQKKKVIASNVDVILIVTSIGKPGYKRGLVDRYLARADYWNIPAFVVFNKADEFNENEFDLTFEAERLKWLNVECFEVSAINHDYSPRFLNQGFKDLSEKLKLKTAVLVGHSGVGKSRLITELTMGKVTLQSGELGKVGKGAHTTTWAELVDADQFELIDSPGIRSMSLSDLTKEDLLFAFSDINQWSTKCQFPSSCQHQENSKGCFFYQLDENKKDSKLILSRLESFQRILSEVELIPDWIKNKS